MDVTRYRQFINIRLIIIVCFMVFQLLLTDHSFGQGHPGKNGPQKQPATKWSTFIRGGYVYQLDTDMDNSNGSFTSNRFFIQPGIRYSPDYTKSFSLAFGYGYDGYDFTGENGFGALRPWDDIHSYRLSAPIRFTKGQNWSFFIVPTLRVSGEKGADLNATYKGKTALIFARQFHQRDIAKYLLEQKKKLKSMQDKGNYEKPQSSS